MSQPAALANLNIRVFTQSGSKTEIGPRNPDFRSSLNSRHSPTRRSRPKSAKSGHRQPLHLTILSALATNVGVAVLIATPDKTTASPTKSRYSPSSTAKNIASASLYCGGKFENKTACYGGQPQGNQEQSKPRGKRTCHGLLRR